MNVWLGHSLTEVRLLAWILSRVRQLLRCRGFHVQRFPCEFNDNLQSRLGFRLWRALICVVFESVHGVLFLVQPMKTSPRLFLLLVYGVPMREIMKKGFKSRRQLFGEISVMRRHVCSLRGLEIVFGMFSRLRDWKNCSGWMFCFYTAIFSRYTL